MAQKGRKRSREKKKERSELPTSGNIVPRGKKGDHPVPGKRCPQITVNWGGRKGKRVTLSGGVENDQGKHQQTG